MAADYTYSNYGGRPANQNNSGSGFDWLQFAADIYKSRQDNKVKSVPLTPEQKQILADVQRRIGALPNVNPHIARTAVSRMGGSAPQLDMDALRRGQPGAYTPPRQLSETELSGILKGGPDSTSPTTTPTPGPGGGSGGGGGFGGGDAGMTIEPTDSKKRLPMFAPPPEGYLGGSTIKRFDDPSYEELNRNTYTPGQGDAPLRGRGQGQGLADLGGFADFLRSQGVQDAAKIAAGFLAGGLTGAALAGAKVLWDRYQQTKGGKP